ncbi:P-loop guanosine triphosphatase YjiA [Methylobacterium crusticola]|uniref:P-loop guanosine triphosphatase YjiA n=1 Tax=Methylobacterium crusticola TaxID=1697972 RepID=A0ABQ4R2S0_9HYPH|nr:GTP-binding protein [Methylobacterium crusticola]GJD51961.1 P-loop guanosine triphosphatase YjiA [Methylobacterium crusticola]
MTVPVVLVAGFLGAGKTTLVNALLRDPGGRRIAALVNDFGAIDVDAALLGLSADGVVSLRNGCICCSLQGDLMRTLSGLLRRRPAPDAIVIETSGAADPAEIVRSLLDPVVYAATPLDTVVTVVDARHLADRPDLFDDALWRSQLAAADFCLVAKSDLVDGAERARVRAGLARQKPPRLTFEAVRGALPSPALLFSGAGHAPAAPRGLRPSAAAERFESMSWTASRPVSLARFQSAIARLAPDLLRAKGFVTFEREPDRPMLFQLVGTRATIVPTGVPAQAGVSARLVLIAEAGRLERRAAAALLDGAAGP